MNYLQRFSRALLALGAADGDEPARRRARREARMEDRDWLGELHRVARRLPPRNSAAPRRRHPDVGADS